MKEILILVLLFGYMMKTSQAGRLRKQNKALEQEKRLRDIRRDYYERFTTAEKHYIDEKC